MKAIKYLNLAKFGKIFIFATFLWSLTWGASLKKMERDPLLYYFDRQDSLLVERLHAKIKKPLQPLKRFFEESFDTPISVMVVKSDGQFHRFLRDQVPEWSQAVAFPQERMIVLKLSDAEQIKKSPQILLHELVHVLLYDLLRGRAVPLWLNEGLAEFFSEGTLSFDKKIVLAEAIVSKKLIDFKAIDTLLNMNAQQARLSYIQSQSAVSYLMEQYGQNRIRILLKNVLSLHSFERAFKQTYGFDFLDFEIRWNEYVSKKYRWLILWKFEEWIFSGIGLLFLIAVLAVYLRNRKKRKQLEEEDEEYSDQMIGG